MTVNFFDETSSDTTVISWLWNFGDNTSSEEQNPTHIYTDIGVYDVKLTVIDILGCTNTLLKNNTVETLMPIPHFSVNDNNICEGELISFMPSDTSNVTSYHWNFGDGTTSDEIFPTHLYTNSGYYDVSLNLVDNHGCDSTLTVNNYIYQQDIPLPNFDTDNSSAECYPLQIQFTDNTNNFNISNWFWDFGDAQTTSELQNPVHIYTLPGSYDVLVKLTTTNGCIGEMTKENYIKINGPTADINNPDTACRNEDIMFIAENQKDVFELKWIFGDGHSSDSDTAYNNYDMTGFVYPVLLIKSDTLGTCDVYIKDTIFIPQLDPQIVFDNEIYNGCIPFEVTASNYCTEAENWMWTVDGMNISQSSNVDYTFPDPGMHILKLFVYDDFGCVDSSEHTVEAYALPTVNAMSDTFLCRGENIVLRGEGAITYNWTPKIWLDDEYSNTPIAEPDSTIIYYVTGTDDNGCKNTSDVTLIVQQEPVIFLRDTAVIIGEIVNFNPYKSEISGYNWFPNYEIDCINCPQVNVRPLEPTVYELTVTDTANCFSLTYDVFVDIIKEYTVDVPAAFTPNGDGINDVVYVRGWGVDNLIMFRIFNRFGEIVFETNDKNIGWDGTFNGVKQGVESYKYHVSIKTYEDKILTKTGTIKLLK